MNIEQIKNKINSDEYSFLRENEHLGNNIILLTCGGSYSYGTNVEGSDLDIRGICLERPNEIIGLSNFEQFINNDTDTTIYGLRKIISLLLNCNPNTIEILGTKEEQLFVCNKYGKLLRDNVDLFLSRKAIASFGGYARQQLKRLQNALYRDSYPQPEKEKHIMNNIKSQMTHMEERYKKITEGELNLYTDISNKKDLETEIYMDMNIKHYPLRDFKNIYDEMNCVIKDYDNVSHRNRKKDELHLNKHAMHLVRLYLMAIDILKGNGIITYREQDRDFLLNIRNGVYSYEEIFEMVDKYEKELNYVADNSVLPSKPNYHKVEELVMEIYREVLLDDKY